MRKLLNKPWFVAVMAVAALALVAHVVFSNGHSFGITGFNSSSLPEETEVVAEESVQKTDYSIVMNLKMPGPVNDPFASRLKKSDTVEKQPEPDLVEVFHLSALWTQGGQTFVVLNNRICQNGDEIGRLKIESASVDGVWLSHWKGRDFLKIGSDFTLTTPANKLLRAISSL